MFTVYHSNDIEILVRLGIHLMKSSATGNSSGNPFNPFHFIVQSNGMELYLKQKIADIEGVCARIECQLPWRFIWSLHDKLFPKDNYPKEMVYNSDNIAWILLQAFTSDEAFKPDNTSGPYGYVIDYIYDRSGDDGVKNINYVKCYSLAHRLAEIFENYLVYRQDWIKSWSRASDDESLASWLKELKEKQHADINIHDYLWISRLWHDYIQVNLIDELREKDRIHYMDSMKKILLNDTKEEFFARIRDNGMEMPADIFVYGISSIAPVVLEFLVLLGKFINVHFMFTNPCRYYWGDIKADDLTDDAAIEKYIEKLKKKHALNLEVKNRNISPDELSKITSESGKSPVSEIKDASGDKYRSEYYEAVDDSLELVESNRLLLTYGKAGRDTLSAIMAYADNENYEINDIHAFVDNTEWESGDDASLLNLIKNDILNMSFTSMTEIAEHTSENGGELSRMRRTVSTNDHSLEFHSCITPLREVQVLYDHILEKFQNDKSLRPRDIAVFMPNVSKYAPFIDAVFGTNRELLFKNTPDNHREGGEERQKINLPYSICDRSTEEECPEIDGFNRLLNIVSGNIDNHALFSLLSIDAIRKRFGIEVEDLENIKKWLNDNNIIFGLDEDDTAIYDVKPRDFHKNNAETSCSAGAGDTGDAHQEHFVTDYRNSLKAGLDRMLIGSLMPVTSGDDISHDYNTNLEGSSSLDLLGHFYAFYDALRELRKEFKKCLESAVLPADILENIGGGFSHTDGEASGELSVEKTVSGWHDFIISRVLNRFFEFGDDNVNLYALIAKHFERMKIDLLKLKLVPKINLEVVKEYLKDKLSAESGFSPFLRDRVNFCSFIPMRAIPFKHIFMLGMNDGEYPKTDNGDYFDLMKTYFRHGDRNRRNDDCYMFLESLISAEKSLYISYLGRDAVKNDEKNPSMLVNELINYITATCMLDRESFGRFVKENKDNIAVSYEDYEREPDNSKNTAIFRKALINEETMNVYDPRNYNGVKMRSYQSQWCPLNKIIRKKDDRVLWKDMVNPELSGLKFVKKNTGDNSGMQECEYVLDISLDELEDFYKHGNKFFVKKVLRLSKYLFERNELKEHEDWSDRFLESNLSRFLINTLSGRDEPVTTDDVRSLSEDYIHNLQEKGEIANGVIGEYIFSGFFKEKSKPGDVGFEDMILTCIKIKNAYESSEYLTSVPVDLRFKVPVERKFIEESEDNAPEEKSEQNNQKPVKESGNRSADMDDCHYYPGETVNVEVRIRGRINDVLNFGDREYLLVGFDYDKEMMKSCFNFVLKTMLLYLESAQKHGERPVSAFNFTEKMNQLVYGLVFDNNDKPDIDILKKEYNNSIVEMLLDKMINFIQLFILGHFCYIPFELVSKFTNGIFGYSEEINPQDFSQRNYIRDGELIFGQDSVDRLEYNRFNGSFELLYNCLNWLVSDYSFDDKFLNKKEPVVKNPKALLYYPTNVGKAQLKMRSNLCERLGIE